ncbi:MAG TPA: cation:proton antiporter [Caulobacteraceae bacterium]|jgi:CPA2 family monovalent cation:H+ antiporter-2|nr:cation:proton antiporter [Caulobacteraceae bacterium]
MEHAGVSPGDYKDLMLFLATAGIVVPLFQRLKISPTLGFLAAGVALGPFGLGALAGTVPWLAYFTVSKPAEVAQLAELGVAFLLFTIGLELSWERLRLMRRMVFGLGALQMALCAGALGLAAFALRLPPAAAVAVGAGLALSSTAVALPVMGEHHRLHRPAGRAAFSALLFQDLAVAPILIVLGVLGRGGGGFSPKALLSLIPAAAGLGLIVLAGRLVLRPMMRSVARTRSDELFIAASLFIVIAASLTAAVSGLSMALGAFVAGLLLAETEFRHEVELRVEPFKGLLLGLFFVSVGIGLDFSVMAQRPWVILGVAAGLVAIKAVLVFAAARLMRLPKAESFETAMALAAGGEFAFVVINEAMGARLVPAAAGETVLIAATLTMFAIPALVAIGVRIGGGAARHRDGAEHAPPEGAQTDGPPRVLVVGFGRVGRLVGEMLTGHKIAWVAIDQSPRLVKRGRQDGHEVFFGDASQAELLKRCGLISAPAVVVTMDAPEVTEAVVAAARQLRPEAVIVARARDARHAAKLYTLGATNAVPETIEASLQLSEAVLVDLGVPMGYVIASIHEKRDEYRTLLNRPDALGGRVRRARAAMERGE